MSIRIFISHSTCLKEGIKDQFQAQIPAHAAFRQLLCERLRQVQDPKIEVVVDEDIPVGRFWRDFLFDEIADCSAAIVLVNKQALHCSPWVETEVTVLGYRARNEKDNFCLIIVPFGGVTEADIASKPAWAPVAISELQMKPRHGLDENNLEAVDQLVQDIVEALRCLPDWTIDNSSSGWLVDHLCALLELKPEALKEFATRINVNTNKITRAHVLLRRVAHAMYKKGPLAIHELLEYPGCSLASNQYAGILKILGTYWVDMAASINLLFYLRGKGTAQVVAINGKEIRFTPQIYVRQVCGELRPWPVIDVDPTDGVVDQIRDELAKHKKIRLSLSRLVGNLERASPEKITKGLNRLLSGGSLPVFITFLQPGGGNVEDLVKQITDTFPDLHIIVCTGTEPGEAKLAPEIKMLTPEFHLAQEEKEFKDYCDMEMHL